MSTQTCDSPTACWARCTIADPIGSLPATITIHVICGLASTVTGGTDNAAGSVAVNSVSGSATTLHVTPAANLSLVLVGGAQIQVASNRTRNPCWARSRL